MVNSPRTLSRIIAEVMPGEEIKINVLREDEHKTLTAVLGKREENFVVPASIPPSRKQKIGIDIQALTSDLAEKFKVKPETGVLITQVKPDSPGSESGLREGDIILEINQEKISSVEEFNLIVESSSEDEDLLFRINRKNASLFLVLKQKEK